MKNLILITTISIFTFMFGACGGGNLSPESVDPNNPVSVNDLVSATAKDDAGWEGKKASVTGYAGGKSTSGNKYTITIRNDKEANFDKTVVCIGEGEVPADLMKKNENWIYTGTVGRIEKDKRVELNNCEIKSK